MLTLVTKSFRARAAWLLAIFYVICVLSPALAVAMDAGRNIACLVDEDQHSGASHIHSVQSASVHHVDAESDIAQRAGVGLKAASSEVAGEASGAAHGSGDTHKHHSNQCCGVSCVSALPAALAEIGQPAIPPAQHQSLLVQVLGTAASKPLYRPPIA
ncbi:MULTISPECIES: hypothetical protein [unclassified Bradyrhizobium]|jgi:hypothetical protein|uniref:hypothetical protein n=1 Tax=unclassified Bradyrhizobium TaxID=2631580 RepID=UPI0012E37D95|nr:MULTISPECIES: hypothetical protein [unclassified Bradyrhizobium]